MRIFLTLIVSWFMLGMNPIPKKFHENKKAITTIDDLPLQNTHWRLIELSGKKVPVNATSKQMYLVLKSDSTISGNGGCNAFSGSYSLGKNNEISFGELVRTNILCPGINYERNYFNAIAKTDHYQIIGNSLSLQNKFTSVAKFVGRN